MDQSEALNDEVAESTVENETTVSELSARNLTSDRGIDKDAWICVVGEDLKNDESIVKSAKTLGLSVAYTNEPAIPDDVPSGCNLAFICKEFDGPLFDKLWNRVKALKSSQVRILGPPCLHYCAAANVALPPSRRPIYSLSMSGVSVCFMGFKANERSAMNSLVAMVRHMGADVRTDMADVTHVVALGVTSSRYERAVALGKSIMSTEWINQCWQMRDKISVRAVDESLMSYRLPPFTNLVLSFFGFQEEDRTQMEDFCQQYGGKAVPFGEMCSHVVCSADILEAPEGLPSSCAAVKMEWFWETIQIRACSNVNLHRFEAPMTASPALGKSPANQRRRTTDVGSHLTPGNRSAALAKRFLTKPGDTPVEEQGVPSKGDKRQGKRRNQCLELQATEENYVSILNHIVKNFVEPLESPNQLGGGSILNAEEVKEIFYPLPQLAALHEKMLAGLHDRFSPAEFDNQACFGDVLLEHMSDMIRIYPRFINFFEGRRECVVKKCRSNPRFTAFVQLRYAEASKTREPYSKQTFTELLIAPVQRIPRYLMLLEGIIKLTDDDHKDKKQLVAALEGFQKAAQQMNEDKRIAEGRIMMLNLQNVVEGLLPTVVASSRTICNVISNLVLLEVGEDENLEIPVSLIIFNDSIEITKRRGGRETITMEELNGSSGSNTLKSASKKPLRHIDFVLFEEMRRLLHFENSEDSCKTNLLGIGVNNMASSSSSQEQWIILRVTSMSSSADQSLRNSPLDQVTDVLHKAWANTMATDSSNFVQVVSTEVLPFSVDFNTTDSHSSSTVSFSKAIKGARHKARKVTRVFSHQVHRLESLTPRRTGLRRSCAPSTNISTRRHIVPDNVSFASHCESPPVTPSSKPGNVSCGENNDTACYEHGLVSAKSSNSGEKPSHVLSDVNNIIPSIKISPAKRSSCDVDDKDDDNLQPGSTGSLPKRARQQESIPKSSSIVEFQTLKLTFL